MILKQIFIKLRPNDGCFYVFNVFQEFHGYMFKLLAILEICLKYASNA